MKNGLIMITCSRGSSSLLKKELSALGVEVTGEEDSLVTVSGDMNAAMKLNLMIRTGQRVLLKIAGFTAGDPDALYRSLGRIRWEDIIPPKDAYVCVTSSVSNPHIRDTRYVNLKCKDSIVDRLRSVLGDRPDSGPQRDRTVIHVYWKDEQVVVYLDTSGESLSKRGYRKATVKAPMQETLAASLIMASSWDNMTSFINPMCGSGTLAIEAALMAKRRAPGCFRDNYGFMHVKGFDTRGWQKMVADARRDEVPHVRSRIIASDIDPDAVKAARTNARTAGVQDMIEFSVCDYADTFIPEGGGIVMVNPEYGERLGADKELSDIYSGIGDFFKKKCRGYNGYVFTGNLELVKKIGLRTKRRMTFYNGGIECRLLEYELYEGTRKKNAE